MKVAVGIIFNTLGNVLITQRSLDSPHGGLWEFPGGKVELNETSLDALVREIKEEVGLTIAAAEFLCEVNHAYENKHVSLEVFCVSQYKGKPTCCEKQLSALWVGINQLERFDFPAANQKIIAKLKQVNNSALLTAAGFCA